MCQLTRERAASNSEFALHSRTLTTRFARTMMLERGSENIYMSTNLREPTPNFPLARVMGSYPIYEAFHVNPPSAKFLARI